MFSTATLIAPDGQFDSAPVLFGRLRLDPDHGAVLSARLRYSALGLVEAAIDGVPVSPAVLTPGWSSYEWRVRVAEADVTHLLGESSLLELSLGNGWYRGQLTWMGARAVYGSELAGIAEVLVRYADGHTQTWGTDETWSARSSDVVADDLYDGQTIDARRRGPRGPVAGRAASVHAIAWDTSRFEAAVGPEVTRREEREPVAVWLSPAGKVIVDFGRNLAGWVRCTVRGEEGRAVTLRHAEVLEQGELCVRPLRSAAATDRFVLSGGHDVFEPTFTFHGFRYVEVDGWPGGIEALRTAPGALTAVAVGSELTRTGTFRCSEPLLDRLHENVVSSALANFVSLPTDCPQRDERLGWTGDIAVFAPTCLFLFDAGDFLRDWLRDVALEQAHQDGVVPYVVPDVLKHVGVPEALRPVDSTAVWSDAVVWVPWAIWQATGDREVLRESFEPMLAHLRHVEGLLSPSGLWDAGFQFGDWLDPDAPPEAPAAAKADTGLVATASLFRSCTLAARAAAVVGREAERLHLTALAARLREAFRVAWVDPVTRRLRNDCQTAYTLAIVFGLLDDDETAWAGARLAALVEEAGFRISTGFAGTPFVLDALSSTGQVEVAGRLLLQRECPSWLYPVTMGATTIWERWDSMLPDGTVNPGEMTSFNHYALGAVADWLHRVLGGLAPLDPGYRRILVAPQPVAGVTWAETELATPHGLARVAWRRDGDDVLLDVTVPSGTTGEVRVGGLDRTLAPGRYHLVARCPEPAGALH